MSSSKPHSALFICLGNICRSPMAEAVFARELRDRGLDSSWKLDSAGIIDMHSGKNPEPRALANLASHGLADYKHKARQLRPSDFEEFEFIFAMDGDNVEDAEEVRRKAAKPTAQLLLFGKWDKQGTGEIPDPYYQSGSKQFEEVFWMCDRAAKAFLDELQANK